MRVTAAKRAALSFMHRSPQGSLRDASNSAFVANAEPVKDFGAQYSMYSLRGALRSSASSAVSSDSTSPSAPSTALSTSAVAIDVLGSESTLDLDNFDVFDLDLFDDLRAAMRAKLVLRLDAVPSAVGARDAHVRPR